MKEVFILVAYIWSMELGTRTGAVDLGTFNTESQCVQAKQHSIDERAATGRDVPLLTYECLPTLVLRPVSD